MTTLSSTHPIQTKRTRLRTSASRLVPRLLFVQGGYYCLTGLWSVVSRTSFEAVTGPKTDYWLVRMVGLLAFSVGISLIVGASRRTVSVETFCLFFTALFAFTIIDVVCVVLKIISPIYLADAAFEIAMFASMMYGLWKSHSEL
jgi:hypothetical protein